MLETRLNMNSETETKDIYRPVQYLGSKLRTLDEINKAVDVLNKKPSRVLDLFSGSSVVSQLFRNKGLVVHSNDALGFCSVIANAIIGDKSIKSSFDDLVYLLLENLENEELFKLFKKEIEMERSANNSGNYDFHINQYLNFPQVWRFEKNTRSEVKKQIEHLKMMEGKSGFDTLGFFSFYYAGTYFGIEQAVKIDIIRKRITTDQMIAFESLAKK